MEQAIEDYGTPMENTTENQNAYDWETYMRSAFTLNGVRVLNSGSVYINIREHYDTVSELPETACVGDIYAVGTSTPYSYYSYSSSGTWINLGNLQGPKGDTGETGATGAKGDKGDKGDDGLTTSVTINGTEHTQVSGNVNLGSGFVVDANYTHTTNDYTNADKSKLAGISDGAEVNVNADWTATSGDAQILNKPTLATVATSGSYDDLSNKPTIPTVNDATLTIKINGAIIKTFTANSSTDTTANITVPTRTSDLTNDSNFVSDTNYVHTDNNYTSSDKTKLDGIASGAEVNVQSDWNETDESEDDFIKNKPTIPTVSNATITIKQNNVTKGTFTTNQSTDQTINLDGGGSGSSTWGSITGTLSNQTDLQTALDAKLPKAVPTSEQGNKEFLYTFAGTTQYTDVALINDMTSSVEGYTDKMVPTALSVAYALSNKVSSEEGKGLSTNDYTTAEKNKLAGIAAGAEVNVNADWSATSGDAQILNKPTIPSKTSDLTNDSGFITSASVPTKTSDLTNDSDFQTGTNVDTKISTHNSSSSAHSDIRTAISGKASSSDLTALTTRVSTVEGDIPSQASSSNQLADKNFVNSSINSVTAYYITKNAAGDPFSTKAELNSATTFYSGGEVRIPTRNDYCIVLADESKTDPTTSENPTTRYIYQSQWEYQYTVNKTSLTAAQLAAINSGITTAGVTKLNGIAEGAEVNVQSDWNATSGDALILNKPTIPTATSDLTNDSNFVSDSSYVHTDNNYTTAEKTKLSGIETGAEVNDIDTIKVNGTTQTITSKAVDITVPKLVTLTQAQYDALTTKDADTYYFIEEE